MPITYKTVKFENPKDRVMRLDKDRQGAVKAAKEAQAKKQKEAKKRSDAKAKKAAEEAKDG